MSSATDASRNKWKLCWESAAGGMSMDWPFTVSLAEESLEASTARENHGPLSSTKVNLALGSAADHRNSPATFSTRMLCAAARRSWEEESPFGKENFLARSDSAFG